MTDSLYKIVRKILIPKYPWINDFVWLKNRIEGGDYYALEVNVDRNFYSKHPRGSYIYSELYDDTKMLFDMIGPEDNTFFDDIIIMN